MWKKEKYSRFSLSELDTSSDADGKWAPADWKEQLIFSSDNDFLSFVKGLPKLPLWLHHAPFESFAVSNFQMEARKWKSESKFREKSVKMVRVWCQFDCFFPYYSTCKYVGVILNGSVNYIPRTNFCTKVCQSVLDFRKPLCNLLSWWNFNYLCMDIGFQWTFYEPWYTEGGTNQDSFFFVTAETVTDELDGACQALAKRLEVELRAAKHAQLACGEVLLPADLLPRIAKDVLNMAENEPCGLR